MRAARQSLMNGRTAVPHVAPAVQVDLRSFFASPPDPSQIMQPLLTLRGDTSDDPECEPELSVEALYFNEFFDDTDADFVDGDYEFDSRAERRARGRGTRGAAPARLGAVHGQLMVRRFAWCAVLFALLSGCGDTRTSSSLTLDQPANAEPGTRRAQAHWQYRSPEVDVDIDLLSVETDSGCTSSAELRIDEALAGTDHYRMPDSDCATLQLTEEGDLVLHGAATGHDWAHEAARRGYRPRTDPARPLARRGARAHLPLHAHRARMS